MCSSQARRNSRSCAVGGPSAADLACPLEQRVDQLVADQNEQLVLGRDVVVEAAGREPGRLEQRRHRGGVVAALREGMRGGVDQLAAAAVVARSQRGAEGGEGASQGPGLSSSSWGGRSKSE